MNWAKGGVFHRSHKQIMNILVTGGSGFIGTNLVTDLLKEGHNVTIYDKQKSETYPDLCIVADIRDKEKLTRSMHGVDAVYHLAAEHRDDVLPTALYYDVNVGGAENMVYALDKNNVNRLIFTSTVAVYGLNLNVAKVGGLQSQGAKGEAVVNLLRTLGNAGSGVLGLSRRANNMASNRPHPLNSSGVGNQKGKHFYDFCLKLPWLIPFLPCCLCNVKVNSGPPNEDSPVKPFNDYGKSKYEAETIFDKWADSDQTHCLNTVRPTVIFGEKNRGNVYNLLYQLSSGKFIKVGKGLNRKSMAYVLNLSSFLTTLLKSEPGQFVYNYADKPDLCMNELINIFHNTLGRNHRINFRIPYAIGLMGGYCYDMLAKITGKTYPISSIRIKKFCADTVVSAEKVKDTGFIAPYLLTDGLKRMISSEFLQDSKMNNPNDVKVEDAVDPRRPFEEKI